MKKTIVLGLFCLTSLLSAQFTVSGTIEQYNKRNVLVRTFRGAQATLINKIQTDDKGTFSVKIPEVYNGMVILELDKGEQIKLLSANENIVFSSVYGEEESALKIVQGKSAKALIDYQATENLIHTKENIFPVMKKIYSPKDKFYKAIVEEEARLDNLKSDDAKAIPLVKYFIETSSYLSNRDKLQSISEDQLLNHLATDGEYLEQAGFLTEIVFAYLNKSVETIKDKEEAEVRIDSAIAKALDRTDLQTARGQNVLSSVFMLVSKKQFPNVIEKYYKEANALTCTLTDELKKELDGSNNIQVGKKAPNILFDKEIKGKKSLYDIKTDQKIVMFWASWCAACISELPFLEEYYRNFKNEGGEIVAISLDSDVNEYNKHIEKITWYNYTDLLVWDSPLVGLYSVKSTPTILLLDKDNMIVKMGNHISELIN